MFRFESGPFVVGCVVEECGVDALQLCDVIRVGDAHRTEVFCAEPRQALFGDRNSEFLDGIDVRDFRENFFLLRIEREDGEVFGIENAENFLA